MTTIPSRALACLRSALALGAAVTICIGLSACSSSANQGRRIRRCRSPNA